MSDQLPVAGGGSGRGIIPATVSGELTTHQGGGGSHVSSEPSRGAAAPATASASTQALISTLNEVAGHLRLSDAQLETYRAWSAQNHDRLGAALEEHAVDEQLAEDKANSTECERVLRTEWGSQYEQNITRINGWLDALPGSLPEAIRQARYFGGQAICSDPGVLRALLAASAAPASGRSDADIDRRISEIHQLMRNGASEYWKGPRAEAIQAEYRELVHLQKQRRP